jgi:Tol biopolymer transport system component
MKKSFLLIAACVIAISTSAQIFEISSIEHLPAASFEDARVAGISPAGDYILLTTGTTKGLQRYDLQTGKLTTLSRAANAGFDVKISKSGNEIAFTERTFYPGQEAITKTICANIKNNTKSVLGKRVVVNTPIALHNEDGLMYIEQNGQRRLLAPFGTEDKIYIWTSLSPDNSKVCYYLSGYGCYVCNLDGSNNTFIGEDCRAAQWYNNNTLVAMHDKDDGHFITAASVLAYTLDGKVQVLTSPDMIAMYPYATQGKIAFSTIEGKTYLITVK